MIRGLKVRGDRGTLLWGYREVATLRTWIIAKKKDGTWQLSATVERVDPFQVYQQPLLFIAPRQEGFWAWPVQRESLQVGPRQLVARLGPPEH